MTAYFRSPRPPRTVGRNKNTFQYRKYGQPPKRSLGQASARVGTAGQVGRQAPREAGMDPIPIIGSWNRLPPMPSAYMPN